jgi:hypothetical protein
LVTPLLKEGVKLPNREKRISLLPVGNIFSWWLENLKFFLSIWVKGKGGSLKKGTNPGGIPGDGKSGN